MPSRKVVGKSARDNPERYCGWFLVDCFSNKFKRMARESMDVRLRGLKQSNKSRFDSYSVKKKCIDHIPYYFSGLLRAQFLRQPFSKQLYKRYGSHQFQYTKGGGNLSLRSVKGSEMANRRIL